jgi:hypothetical protein
VQETCNTYKYNYAQYTANSNSLIEYFCQREDVVFAKQVSLVLSAVASKVMVFWIFTSRRIKSLFRRFGGMYRLQIQGE